MGNGEWLLSQFVGHMDRNYLIHIYTYCGK